MRTTANYNLSGARTIEDACLLLRSCFHDLYSLPRERFRSLIAPAVRLGIRKGDFIDGRAKMAQIAE